MLYLAPWGMNECWFNKLQEITTHCITLQHTATHCNTLQHTNMLYLRTICYISLRGLCTRLLQLTATHFDTLQHANMLYRRIILCTSLRGV